MLASQEVANNNNTSGTTGSTALPQFHRYSVAHAAENMPEFDPASTSGKIKSAKAFVTRIRALQAHYGWSEFLVLEAAQQKLRGEAKLWNEESADVYTTFADFERDLLSMYPAFATPADVLEEILAQKRGPRENLDEFCRRMIVLGRRGKVPDADLVQYTIKRINHAQFATSIGCVQLQTMAELLQAVAVYNQKFPADRATHHHNNNEHHNTANTKEFARTSAGQQSDGRERKDGRSAMAASSTSSQVRCWNCSALGHTSNKCPAPKKECAICKRRGHDAKDCRATPKPADRVFRIERDGGRLATNSIDFEKQVTVNGETAQAYVDGGSTRSLISRSLAAKIGGVKPIDDEEPVYVKGFNGEPVECVNAVVPVVIVDEHKYVGPLLLVDDEQLYPDDVLLGTDLLCGGVGNYVLIGNNECKVVSSASNKSEQSNIEPVAELLKEFAHCFSETLKDLGKATTTAMHIELTTTTPVAQRGCRVPFAKRAFVSEMIEELLETGIIVPSRSPYAAQIVLVPKSSGEDRMCVDYRPLNAVTMKHHFPMPLIDEMMARLAGNRFFTTLDLMSGYYQIALDPDSQKYTAFDTHEGHYEFTRMPFGLANAPSVFQQCMNELQKELPPGELLVYFDDIVIPSKTIEEGVDRLRRFLGALTRFGLTLRMNKCVFLAERIKFLGHIVCSDGIEPSDNKVAAIAEFPEPRNANEGSPGSFVNSSAASPRSASR